MAKHHPKNERIKRSYLIYLEEAKRMAPDSVDAAAAAIAQFEEANGWKDFAAFHIEQARVFKRYLDKATNPKTGKPLAKATIYARLMATKAFFAWLAEQSGYKSRIKRFDCDYFNPSAIDSRIATTHRVRPRPSIEQVLQVLRDMPHESPVEKRDRALIAFTLLTGARVAALASFNLGHVDLERRIISQDARTVRTKNAKSFVTSFFPVGQAVEDIVIDWVQHLKRVELFGPDDPLFAATRIVVGPEGGFTATGLDRRHWKSTEPIRKIFRSAFAAAKLPTFDPHSFRHTLTQLGMQVCNEEEFKAWSMNLGHESERTTRGQYGALTVERQTKLMDRLRNHLDGTGRLSSPGCDSEPDAATIAWVLEHMKRSLKS